jgi:hypothetical protein
MVKVRLQVSSNAAHRRPSPLFTPERLHQPEPCQTEIHAIALKTLCVLNQVSRFSNYLDLKIWHGVLFIPHATSDTVATACNNGPLVQKIFGQNCSSRQRSRPVDLLAAALQTAIYALTASLLHIIQLSTLHFNTWPRFEVRCEIQIWGKPRICILYTSAPSIA